MKEIVAKFRSNPPKELSGQPLTFTDLSLGSALLPPTDGLRFDMDSSRVIIRPSGTEPKLKCYLQVIAESEGESRTRLKQLTQDVNQLLSNLG